MTGANYAAERERRDYLASVLRRIARDDPSEYLTAEEVARRFGWSQAEADKALRQGLEDGTVERVMALYRGRLPEWDSLRAEHERQVR